MRHVSTITLSLTLGAVALGGCQIDRLATEPTATPSASAGAPFQQAVSGSWNLGSGGWADRWEWTDGNVELAKNFGSPMLFTGDIVAEGGFTSNLAYKHQDAEDGSSTFTGAIAGSITLAVSEFLGEPVTGTLEGTMHAHVNRSYVRFERTVLQGTGDLAGYMVQIDLADGPAWPIPGTYTGTVFGHGTD